MIVGSSVMLLRAAVLACFRSNCLPWDPRAQDFMAGSLAGRILVMHFWARESMVVVGFWVDMYSMQEISFTFSGKASSSREQAWYLLKRHSFLPLGQLNAI